MAGVSAPSQDADQSAEMQVHRWTLALPVGSWRIGSDRACSLRSTRLFEQQGVEPPQRHIEADQESVIESLVVSGVGVSLMREESARVRARAGEICIWTKARLRTTLWFVCAAGREADSSISALFSLLRETWDLPEAAARKSAPTPAPAPSGEDRGAVLAARGASSSQGSRRLRGTARSMERGRPRLSAKPATPASTAMERPSHHG